MFLKAKEFTEELLKENERLRFKIARLEAGGGPRPVSGDDRAQELTERVRELEERLSEVEARYRKVEEENKEFADRYIEIEEQNNNLANLYVASYQLHSTLDYSEVIRIVQEIVINLIGAEAFHLFVVSDKTGQLELETSEGQDRAGDHHRHRRGPHRHGRKTGENYFAHTGRPQGGHALRRADRRHPAQDQGQRHRRDLDQQAAGAEDARSPPTDYELFTLLAGHAATAIFSAKLYSTSARKLTTLQGFLDMIKTQPAKP